MCWLGILGVFIGLYMSTHAEIYNTSNFSTEWRNANCTKAEPKLSYNNFVFEVNETNWKLPTSDVWIGYLTAKVPFYFHGCAVVQHEQTYRVTSIGYCKNICAHTEIFGIQTNSGLDIFNPTVVMNCRCVNASIDKISLGKCGSDVCIEDCHTIFSKITDSVNFNKKDTDSDSDCLAYFYPGFEWKRCKRLDSIQTLCSHRMRTGLSSTEYISILDTRTYTWTNANAGCLDDDMFPATGASINNTTDDIDEQQYYWTGIVRASTLLREDSIPERLLFEADNNYFSDVSYGFLNGHTGIVNFTNKGTKQALCTWEGTRDATKSAKGSTTVRGVTESTERPTLYKDVTKSARSPTPLRDVTELAESPTTLRGVGESTEYPINRVDKNRIPVPSRKSVIIGVGIGVSVTVLVVAIFIIVLRRRKKRQRCSSHKSSASMIDNIDCKARSLVTAEKSVSDHNCHVQENNSISETEHLDHNSKANVPNEAIVDAVIYHTINDAVEPRGHVTGDTNDYDYTTTKVAKTEMDTDNVYNKLKLERHGEYNHVKGHCQVHDLPTSNHYDTASVSVKENATLARVNDDYDHVGGKGRIHIAATSNDYDMTDSAMAVRSRAASANVDEGEYNQISNPP